MVYFMVVVCFFCFRYYFYLKWDEGERKLWREIRVVNGIILLCFILFFFGGEGKRCGLMKYLLVIGSVGGGEVRFFGVRGRNKKKNRSRSNFF